MNPLLHDLPYDDTGKDPSNRTKREFHDLSLQQDLPFRTFAMDKGYFYPDDMMIVDERGYELIPDIDYQCTCVHPEIIQDTGLTATALIVIKNPRVHPKVYVDANMVGGVYRNMAYSIVELARGLLNNTRKVHYVNILNRPDAFRVNGHMHALWDLYGFTPRTAQLIRMTKSIVARSENSFDDVLEDFKMALKIVSDRKDQGDKLVTDHINNKNDPHRVRAVQIGLDQVANLPVATEAEARQANSTVRYAYATPWSVRLAIESNFTPIFANHVNNTNNPHQLNAGQLLAYTIQETQMLLNNYYDRGTTVNYAATWLDQTWASMYANIRLNNDVGNITSGVLDQARYATGSADRGWMLTGNGQWVNIKQRIEASTAPKPVNCYFETYAPLGYWDKLYSESNVAATLQQVNTAYNDPALYPIGTIVVMNMWRQWWIKPRWTPVYGQLVVRRQFANRNANDWTYNAGE